MLTSIICCFFTLTFILHFDQLNRMCKYSLSQAASVML